MKSNFEVSSYPKARHITMKDAVSVAVEEQGTVKRTRSGDQICLTDKRDLNVYVKKGKKE